MNNPGSELVDIGVNLTDKRFKGDIQGVLERAREAGVSHCIITGTSIATSETAITLCHSLADEFPGMLYTTAGIHPHEADQFTANDINTLAQLIQEHPSTVVAIGETGLDFNRNFSTPKAQETAFEAHLEMAGNLGLPLFLHERDAFTRQHEILRTYRDHIQDAVIHCFTGSRKSLYAYLDLDLHIGITGWVCDERRGAELQRLVSDIPASRLMLETDAPYLLPRTLKPKPKSSRNEPAYLTEILRMVAHLRDCGPTELAHTTSQNARRFFQLDGKSI